MYSVQPVTNVLWQLSVWLTGEKQVADSGNYVGKFSLLNRSDSGDDEDDDDDDSDADDDDDDDDRNDQVSCD